MRVQIGLGTQRMPLPGGGGFYVELRKQGGAGRLGYSDLEGAAAVTRARYVWDRAVEGYRLPGVDEHGDPCVLRWPAPPGQRDETPVPSLVFEGLDEDILVWLPAAFAVQNETVKPEWLVLLQWVVRDGYDGVPQEIIAALATNKAPSQELQDLAREALGDPPPSMGQTLGNLGDSSSGNLTPVSPATCESDTPSPES